MPGISMEAVPSAGVGTAGGARKLGRWLTRWWYRAPDGRVYQRRRADVLLAAAGLGVVIVCGVLVANRLVVGPDVALFHRINHWPGWLYPSMWVVQLSGIIGAPPLLAAAAALLRRFRLAAALVAALLKVSLESVAKTFVQRGWPAETVPDVIYPCEITPRQRPGAGLMKDAVPAVVPVIEVDAVFAVATARSPSHTGNSTTWLPHWLPN